MSLTMEILATDGDARRGRITTPRGAIETPVFMPVGTRGAVVHLDASDYGPMGAEIVLGNTYHLMLRPGAEEIASLGGLHGFTGWSGHFLTDSGGFQVMSLKPRIEENGATFRSIYDGREVTLTPEDATRIQERLGADFAMVLDICPSLPSPGHEVREATERTHRWAERARAVHTRSDQTQFGIVQGGIDPALRTHSARILAGMEFGGYGIGGLSVGETREQMMPALRAATAELPADRPRYLMGVGDPLSIVEAVAAGVDMFDCVLPTRLARHGTVLTWRGRLNLRNAVHRGDPSPLDPRVEASAGYSRAYLRHLLTVKEPSAGRILTLHNLAFLFDLVAAARAAIEAGELASLRHEIAAHWN